MPRRRLVAKRHPTERLVGSSPSIRALRAQIRHLVTFDTLGNQAAPTILLQGETGTGKGLVARIIHDSGPRAKGPFIEVNCAAIPDTLLEAELFGFEAGAFTDAKSAKPGLIEAASGGMLFLDEIDALPLPLQSKFLTVVEEKRLRRLGAVADHAVDVKLIAATQMGLSGRVAEGRFRSDLYHRLAVVILELVPLRQRGKDIVILAEHVLRQYAEAHGVNPKRLSRDANAWLLSHAWPGNVRELSHLMERATLLCPEATLNLHTLERLCLPLPSAQADPLAIDGGRESLDEPALIRQALMRTQGSVVGAARLLGLSRSALRYRLRRYGIERPDADLHPAQACLIPDGSEDEDGASADRNDPYPSPLPEGEGGMPTWEKRPVSILAIDLVYPNTIGDEASYEPWTVALRWERSIAQKVHGFGGILLQHSPSLFIIAFGLPHTLDQMPQRAVQAAVTIRRLLTEASSAAGGEACPELRLAVHTGEVFVDVRASPSPRQLLAVGDTLSLPVRLLGLAALGELLVSSQVGRMLEGWFELQDRALPFGVGSDDQTKAYAVIRTRARRLPLAMHGGHPLSRFVGRDYELACLHERLAQAERGHGQVVGIVGEPGVGKSRLVFEFRQGLTAHRVMVLEGRCLSYGNTMPYLPVLDFLKSYFHIEEHHDGQKIRDQVASKIVTLDQRLEDTVPYLLSLLAVSEPIAALQQMDPQIKRRRTFEAIKRLLLRESLNQPLLLVVEDLHWMDGESQAFFTVLSESLMTTRMLLLVTQRPEVAHVWDRMTSYTQLRLHPLARQEAEKLLTTLLGERAELQGLKEVLLAKSEGNPFFLEELVQALVDQGVLRRTASGGAAVRHAPTTPPVTEIQLPLTVQEVLAARIDRLPAEEKALLQTVAVIGKGSSFSLLGRVLEQSDEEGLYQLLSHLQRGEFIYDQTIFPESSYTFKHALTQEVAYRSLFPEQRRSLHERTAHAIEELFHDALAEHYSELAHHYRRSGNTMKAVVYLQLIGQQAVEQSAYAEAIGHVSTALELLKTVPDSLECRQQELALQTTLGPALMGVRGFSAPEVEQVYTRARQLCQEVGETPQLFQVLQGLSAFYALRGKLETLRDLVEQRLNLARRQQAPDLLLPAHIALGHTLLALGEVASARVHLEQGLTRYSPEPHQSLTFGGGIDPIRSGRCHAALVMWLLGHPDQAQENLYEMLTLFEGSSNPYGLPVALLFAAILHQFRREDALTLERAEVAITLSTERGFPQLLALGIVLRGWVLAGRQQGMAGIAQIHEGLAAWRATGAELLRPYVHGLLAEAYRNVGQANEGLIVLDEALATVQETGERWWEAEIHRLKGELLLLLAAQKGDSRTTPTETAMAAEQDIGGPGRSSLLLEAETSLLEARKIARRQQAKSLELRAALSLSALWQRRGQDDAARGLLAETYSWFTEGFDTADLQAAKVLLDELS